MTRLVPLLALAALWLAAAPARAELPIFDAHIHYSQGDWGILGPDRVLGILDAAGISRALVSSTPDDGTLKLYERAPRRIVPFLRPYRTRDDMATWPRDPAVAAYVEQRLHRGIYRGIGEFHLSAGDVTGPTVRRLADLAAERGIFVQAHVDAETVEKLLTAYPRVKVLWAHAGMSAGAETVRRLLDRFPALFVELALRTDVAPHGALDPAWRALFLRHPDRFMVGTDTWTTSRWDSVVEGMREIRRWLAQLPFDVAERIAYRNADRLFPPPRD
jgi:predicted TIM-barrel fold metal-dependent hydrolase